MTKEHLGVALTSTYSVVGGTARLFERGAVLNGIGGELVLTFAFPMLGRPSITLGNTDARQPFPPNAINFNLGNWQLEQLAPFIQLALRGRIGLLPTGKGGPPITLGIGRSDVITSGVGDSATVFGVAVRSSELQERQLYDVVLLADGDQWRSVAPHAVYHRARWSDFGIAHITDMHVARRIDRFRDLLVRAGRAAAAQEMYQWNDSFRGFVRYANFLHGIGVLDVVLATGDLYDFIFEVGDDPAGGGNAAFLRQLILGTAPGPEFPDVEELLVPIFLVPGNHDYRKHPYKLLFDIHPGVSTPFFDVGIDIKRLANYSGYNLSQQDALLVTNALDGRSSSEVENVDLESAARMLEVDKEIRPYKAFLADRGSYIVRLGAHCIAMVDSSHDVGGVSGGLLGILNAVRVKLGLGSEDEVTFVGGSPNCEGVSADELKMVSEALAETPERGLFILGLHAPLFNMWSNDYPYYLRETQRAAQPGQVHSFLAQRDTLPILAGEDIEKQVEARHPHWFAGAGDRRVPSFVARVDTRDHLDFGVSRGHAEELMKLLAGIGSRRAADVVLAGHTHRHNEFSVRKMPTGELAYFMDFYTQNPPHYYPTRFTRSWRVTAQVSTAAGAAGLIAVQVPETEVTYVAIVNGAAPGATPGPMAFKAKFNRQVQVPPYPTPLSSAPDPRAWWSAHRPLVLQTGALGPLESSQVSFTGFRVLLVKDDVIEKIHFVSTAKLAANNYQLPWEEAIRPVVPAVDPRQLPWSSVSEGRTIAGGPIRAVRIARDRIALFVADTNGGIFTTAGNPDAGWGPWSSVSEGGSVPGARIAALVTGPERVSLFVADRGGGVFAASGSPDTGWGPWSSVSEGATIPGGPISAVLTGPNRVSLFLADPGGGVFTASGSPDSGWGPWSSVSEGGSIPGAHVTAVGTGGDNVSLFVADRGGGVFTASGSPDGGWGPWLSVSEGSTIPGGPISALKTGPDRITLFVADRGGGVFTVSGSAKRGWGPWLSVSEGGSIPGAPIMAVTSGSRVSLFAADLNGSVFTASGVPEDGWGPWLNVSEGGSIPGAVLAAVPIGGDRIAVFVADTAGGVFTTIRLVV